MALSNTKIEDIEFDHVQALIRNEIYESKFIEYKRDLGDLKENRTEFLNDITAMANAEGGDIIYGIQEEQGKPSAIIGLNEDNLDDRKLQIENIIRDSVSPRLRYEIKFIKTNINNYILLIRIPKSTTAPHMVIYKSGQGFYIRNLSGKHKMDINEI